MRRTFLLLLVLLTNACTTSRNDDAQQTLTIYTGRDKDEVAKVVELFTKAHPAIKVNVITLGAQAALDRLRAEKSNPQAGFMWGGTLQGLQQAAGEGLLASSIPANANLIDPARKDPQGRWYAEMLLPEVIIYNHDLLKPEQAPKDWDDLITPAFKDKIVIRDVLASGTMRTIFSAMIYRQYAAKGSPEAGSSGQADRRRAPLRHDNGGSSSDRASVHRRSTSRSPVSDSLPWRPRDCRSGR